MRSRHMLIASASLAILPFSAAAQTTVAVLDHGDTAWMIVASMLGLLMTIPGAAACRRRRVGRRG